MQEEQKQERPSADSLPRYRVSFQPTEFNLNNITDFKPFKPSTGDAGTNSQVPNFPGPFVPEAGPQAYIPPPLGVQQYAQF